MGRYKMRIVVERVFDNAYDLDTLLGRKDKIIRTLGFLEEEVKSLTIKEYEENKEKENK